MKAIFATAAVVAALATAAPAAAEVEGSLGYSRVDADAVEFDAITGRLGWRSTWWGVEGELTAGLNDETVSVAGVPVEVELKHQAAVYGKVYLPVNESLDLFARVGYGTNKIEASGGGTGFSGSDESVNYGVGGQWLIDGVNGVRADWTRHDFDEGGEADAWSVSYVRKF
jgi:outer membrane immunogenic protein